MSHVIRIVRRTPPGSMTRPATPAERVPDVSRVTSVRNAERAHYGCAELTVPQSKASTGDNRDAV